MNRRQYQPWEFINYINDLALKPQIKVTDSGIRHGNTLVGYATADETEAAVKGVGQTNLLFNDAWEDIRIRLIAVEEAYKNFQIQQVELGGHVTHAELDGRVIADDVGLGKLTPASKPDYVGKRLLDRYGLKAADRPQLVGLKPEDPKDDMKAGAHILKPEARPSTVNDQGWISSVCYSPSLGHMIALAFVKSGRERMGESVVVWDKLRGIETKAVICSPDFIDPEAR